MRWPFMLRSTRDADVAYWRAIADEWRVAFDKVRDSHDAYVAAIAERTIPPAKPVPAPLPVKVKDSADVAIETAAMFDPRRRRYLEQFVRERRAAGDSPENIAQVILHPPASGDGEWEMPE